MGCFGYFKEKKPRRNPGTRSSAPSSSAAASTAVPSSSPTNKNMSKSEESPAAAGKPPAAASAPPEHCAAAFSAIYEKKVQKLRVFELKELSSATGNFSRANKIGEGGFGSVFRGSIKPLGRKVGDIAVAVKKLNQNGLQGHKQWLAEVQLLGIVEHKNLVKLVGYCSLDGEKVIQRLLVYEFMPNRSLEDHLFDKSLPCLPWSRRLQVALGAAEGLAYLHQGMEVQLIYRDFKSSNILLDEEFNPKLSDFGLAREGPSADKTHVSTAVMGTYGYAAPEYLETGHLTAKSDVWSFGVVLFEILSGRRSIERNRPRSEQKLLDWVRLCRDLRMIMDPRLGNRYSYKGAKEVAKLACSCLSKNLKDRPTMTEVVEALKQAEAGDVAEEGAMDDEEVFSFDLEDDGKSGGVDGTGTAVSLRRRMLHLARLKESANGAGMRRLSAIKAPG